MPESQTTQSNEDFSVEEEIVFPIYGRIAVYDNMRSIPRIVDFNHKTIKDFIDEVPQRIYSISHKLGGKIPYTILKEVVENLIHADFKDIIITIMDNGNNIIISDQGPGIPDKDRAFLPGYTSATSRMKKYIRGVGSGLPIVKETIVFSGGSVDVDNNIKKGTVVSLKILEEPGRKFNAVAEKPEGKPAEQILWPRASGSYGEKAIAIIPDTNDNPPDKQSRILREDIQDIKLSIRQKKILSLMLELEESGPAKIAKELGFSLSTSYRELIFLENLGLLLLTESGKRSLTAKGKKYLEYYSNSF